MKNKKAELTTKHLVMIIVLIVSFIIVLFLLFRLNLGETTSKEICQNSVLLKHQTKVFAGPLDCRTNYLCISGGGKCDGIPTTSTIKVDPNKEETKKEIRKALADEMSDCWWMFGEGKIDYADRGTFSRTACSICSIVEFDETLHGTSISYEEFYNYLRTTPKTSSQTYLEYLYGTSTLDNLPQEDLLDSYLNKVLELDKTYFILTGMIKEGHLTRIGKFVSPIILAWRAFFATEEMPYPVVILERTQENYNKIGCDIFLTKA